MLKVRLFVLGKKGFSSLEALVSNGYAHMIGLVVIAGDKNVLNDYKEQSVDVCERHKISYALRTSYDSADNSFAFSVAIGWRWLLSYDKSSPLIVLHDSILPRYRGFSPLVNMLINGEKQLGVTALYASKHFDEGDIVCQEVIDISYPLKIQNAIDLIANLYNKIILNIFSQVEKTSKLPSASPQLHDNASYSLWRNEDDYWIDWSKDAEMIKRFVDAVGYPYKGAKTTLNGKVMYVHDVSLEKNIVIENDMPGKVIWIKDGIPSVVCGSGLLQLTNISDENNQSLLPFERLRVKLGV